MTAKEFLQQGYKLNTRIKAKQERIEELRTIAEKSTQTLSAMPKGTNTGSRMEEIVARIDILQREIEDDLFDLLALQASIMRVVREVNEPDAALVLELRYLCYKSWPEVAEEMHYELRQVYRIHGHALSLVKIPEHL